MFYRASMKDTHEKRAKKARKHPYTNLNDQDPSKGPTHKAGSSYEASSGQPSHHTDTGNLSNKNKTDEQSIRSKLMHLLPS